MTKILSEESNIFCNTPLRFFVSIAFHHIKDEELILFYEFVMRGIRERFLNQINKRNIDIKLPNLHFPEKDE